MRSTVQYYPQVELFLSLLQSDKVVAWFPGTDCVSKSECNDQTSWTAHWK